MIIVYTIPKTQVKVKESKWQKKKRNKGIKGYLNKVFIDGLSGMALGLLPHLL